MYRGLEATQHNGRAELRTREADEGVRIMSNDDPVIIRLVRCERPKWNANLPGIRREGGSAQPWLFLDHLIGLGSAIVHGRCFSRRGGIQCVGASGRRQ